MSLLLKDKRIPQEKGMDRGKIVNFGPHRDLVGFFLLDRSDITLRWHVERLQGDAHVVSGDRLAADPTIVLTPAEHLFVQAWQARQAPKTRFADGLDWDAEGFSAP